MIDICGIISTFKKTCIDLVSQLRIFVFSFRPDLIYTNLFIIMV